MELQAARQLAAAAPLPHEQGRRLHRSEARGQLHQGPGVPNAGASCIEDNRQVVEHECGHSHFGAVLKEAGYPKANCDNSKLSHIHECLIREIDIMLHASTVAYNGVLTFV